MSLLAIYKIYKTIKPKEDKRISKNRKNLIKNKYLKKISI